VPRHRSVGYHLRPTEAILRVCENQARRDPSRSSSVLPETELLEFCNQNGIVFLAFAPLGHGVRPGLLDDPIIAAIAKRVGKTPAQVLLAWAVQRGTAFLTTPKSAAQAQENFNISPLPQDALDQINRIQTRQRLNEVVKTGVPGFIAKSKGA
jgi:alcohol dehydrogenase (NADP+)